MKANLCKRIIPCLDVRDGRLTKGIKFENNIDIGDPVETAKKYYKQGADEIVFYDITASHEKRGIMLEVVENVAKNIFIPFCVGGGINSVEDMRAVLLAGAEKISVNSAAVKNPKLIEQGANAFGSQAIVVGMDIKQVEKTEKIPSGYEIVIHGGRTYCGIDAIAWAKQCEQSGAGELCVNSIDEKRLRNQSYENDLRSCANSCHRFGRRRKTGRFIRSSNKGQSFGSSCRIYCPLWNVYNKRLEISIKKE